MSIPTIQGIAGVTADPELKFIPSGAAVLSVRLAFSDRKFNEQTREWETSKSFYVDGTAWEQTAERLAEQLRKGDQVYVEGRIETQSWEKDGEKKSKPVLQLRSVRKVEKAQQAPATAGANTWQAPATTPAATWGTNEPTNNGQPPF